VTGCLSDGSAGPGADDGTDTDDPTSTPMPTDDTDTPDESSDGTATDTPSDQTGTPDGVTSRSFEVTDSGCGQQTDDATVSFDDETVTVTGTVWGDDLTYTAKLASATYDGSELTVTVATERKQSLGTESPSGTDSGGDEPTETTGTDAGGDQIGGTETGTPEGIMGGQCIIEIDYEATVTVSGNRPVSVVVVHRHDDTETTVTDVTR
jgi:hypothetical protein